MFACRLWLLILTLSVAPLASATPLRILGFDDMSCAAWTQSKNNPDQRELYLAWARGALSGHNYALQSQQVSEVSVGTVALNLTTYCNKNPNGSISDAIFRMSDKFSGRNDPIRK